MTHYETLSVAPTATLEQIKKARRDAAHLYHPDRLQQMPESVRALAEAQFKRINAAYDVLSDPAQRRAYDASLQAGQPSATTQQHGTTQQRGARAAAPMHPQARHPVHLHDRSGMHRHGQPCGRTNAGAGTSSGSAPC